MMRIFLSIIATCVLFVSGFWHQALASSQVEKTEIVQLFESKCSLCHSIDRAKSKKKSKAGWEAAVMRMKNKYRAPITDEETKMIIDYLAEEYGKQG
jgi:nitrate/TMAO reductase-like tetraheme cytochrome c subunit